MRFLVDAQLPPALAVHLVSLVHDAQHVYRLGLIGADDEKIWAHAKATACVVVTKDDDFIARRVLDAGGPQIVWVRLGNLRRPALLAKFDDALPEILRALEAGEGVVEVI